MAQFRQFSKIRLKIENQEVRFPAGLVKGNLRLSDQVSRAYFINCQEGFRDYGTTDSIGINFFSRHKFTLTSTTENCGNNKDLVVKV